MRVFKFRAWDKHSKRMVQPNDGDFIGWHAMSNWRECLEVMQFTGLTDANGVEIYEGDIVDCNLVTDKGVIEDHIGKVFFDDFEYVIETKDNLWPVASWKCVSRCEVIGNIHQNPELMEFEQ